ncbi:ATP-binding cassette domain-containing protein, partial [Pseudomonas aeruginosa]
QEQAQFMDPGKARRLHHLVGLHLAAAGDVFRHRAGEQFDVLRRSYWRISAPPGSEARTLRGLTLAIPAGSVVGVIGPSGSGKSSLARVVLGIWPTLHGSVRLDGAEILQYERETLGPRIG